MTPEQIEEVRAMVKRLEQIEGEHHPMSVRHLSEAIMLLEIEIGDFYK